MDRVFRNICSIIDYWLQKKVPGRCFLFRSLLNVDIGFVFLCILIIIKVILLSIAFTWIVRLPSKSQQLKVNGIT